MLVQRSYISFFLAPARVRKHLFFWRDEVIFGDHHFKPPELGRSAAGREAISSKTAQSLDDVFVSMRSIPGNEWDKERYIAYLERGHPRWGENQENYDYPEPEDPYEHAYNAILRFHENRLGVSRFTNGMDVHYAEGDARWGADFLRDWKELQALRECEIEATYEIEETAIAAAATFGAGTSSPTKFRRFVDVLVPESLSSRGTNWLRYARTAGHETYARKWSSSGKANRSLTVSPSLSSNAIAKLRKAKS